MIECMVQLLSFYTCFLWDFKEFLNTLIKVTTTWEVFVILFQEYEILREQTWVLNLSLLCDIVHNLLWHLDSSYT